MSRHASGSTSIARSGNGRPTWSDVASACAPLSFDTVDAESRHAIECSVADPPRALSVASASVGEVLRRDTVCVSSDALLGEVKLLGPGRACIMGKAGALRGVLNLDASRASPCDAWMSVTAAMVPVVRIREEATLHDALRAMVRGHARSLTVMREDGTVVGVVDDLAILHWCVEHRGR